MANKQNMSSDKPSLEELLQFKQAEQPTEAFWDQFDRELHQRMLQTLVKKDPWPIQLMRGLSGRIAQMGAVAAAVIFLAVGAMRPAFVATEDGKEPIFATVDAVDYSTSGTVDLSIPNLQQVPESFVSSDYRIDTVLSSDVISTVGVTREFEMDSIQVSAYDASVYTADSAFSASPAFASAGVALVF